MTKNSARNWFFIGTFACMIIFFGLTIHTMSTIPAYTNSDKLTEEVVAGKKVWEKYNCIGCHTLIGEGSYYAPELKDIYSQKGPDFMRAFLKDPVTVWYGSAEAARGKRKMPNFGLSDQEIAHLIAFFEWVDKIDTHDWPPRPQRGAAQAASVVAGAAATDPLVAQGEVLVQAKACAACHKIKGVGGAIGPDLDGVTQRLDPETLRQRLLNPKAANPESVMPNFGFSDAEMDAIVAYLKTL